MPGTVTVACKVPSGLHLRLFRMEDFNEPVMGGGTRTVKRAVEMGQRVTVKGFAHPSDKAPTAQISGGYALTPGVDADFFKAWLEQNAESAIVKNKLIFAHEKATYAESQSREQAELVCGLEPIDPAKMPKGLEKAKV
jgi:hypothetical protein